ncbi:MAG: Ig-like domain-containing protein, partial [Lachnospiraceae bacterium]
LFGTDMKTALGGGLLTLQSGKDKITVKSFVEAAKVFGNVGKNAENLVVNSANEVKGVVEAVKEVNASADIALLGMFNPYGNSLEYQGKTRDLCAVVTGIFKGSAELLIGSLIGQVDEEAAVEAANEAAAGFNLEQDADSEDTAKGLSKAIKNLEKCVKQVVAKGKLKMQSLVEKLKPYVNVVVNEISYPLQYLTLGKNVTPQMLSLNEKLAAIAEEFGITYVDVYGISNEQNLDPHPDENGHREIAKILFATMSDTVAAGMDAMTVTLDQEKTEIIAGNTTQLKASEDVTWTSDNPDVAEVDENGVVTAKGLGKTIIRAITKKGAEALCNVTVLSKYVYECEKDGIYRYTAKTSVVKKLKKAGWSYKKVMRVPAAGKKVYYIQDKTTKKFRYTSSLALAKKMKKAGNKAGVAFYQSLRKTTPVYEYSDGAENETFRYAATSSAREQLLAEGYTEVGIAWYVLPKAA